MKRLFINADDLGLTQGVTDAIVESMLKGIVGSTSLMACELQALDYGAKQALKIPGKVGIHLQLTDGVPCSEPSRIPSLIGKDGRFPRSRGGLGTLNGDEILIEWQAQMQRVLEFGIVPSHIDTHHHIHRHPAAFEAYVAIAKYLNVPARTHEQNLTRALRARGVRCADYCETEWCSKGPGAGPLLSALQKAFAFLPEDATVELMCHPAYLDAELAAKSTYCEERVIEMDLFCDPNLLQKLQSAGILLIDRRSDPCAERTN